MAPRKERLPSDTANHLLSTPMTKSNEMASSVLSYIAKHTIELLKYKTLNRTVTYVMNVEVVDLM